ncbi:hypothetical protein ACFFJ4_07130 [Xanthomonas dyei]|jgi:hypothetical protein|uniref:Uncharacterized protein n=1 Tax=Xanthomonas dyei TaxID=743699 RepID=A0ABZ0DDQ7_9XANT|nr:hypothetical protein [Xanthomonas dyei]MCC4631957.1 hypothetical protein [Xanthomonas dyei pv. eucalypti]WOB26747.1 hypothetical protein NYR99_01665 [Xanthomonas dyei]WOB54367.1 hypothetical protein NYR95_01665 [Xanthomonas dyei]
MTEPAFPIAPLRPQIRDSLAAHPRLTPVIAARSQRLLTPPDALPVDTTRFNQAWAPDGGEVQQTWAFRSGVARAALSMTGALRQPCNQRERDQRLEKCFGRQYPGDVEPPASPGR